MLGIVASLLFGTSESGAQVAEPLITVSVSKTTGLQNGEPITIRVKTRSDVRIENPGFASNHTVARMCPESPADVPLASIRQGSGGICARGVLSSAQIPEHDVWRFVVNAARTEGEFELAVGVGATEGNELAGKPQVECDSEHPCRLAVAAYVSVDGGRGQWVVDSSTVLTFGEDDPLAGCGKADPNGLTFGSSERIAEAWATWTRRYCAQPGNEAGAPTTGAFDADGSAIDEFDAGIADLAYVGSAQAPLGERPNKRRFVAVPVALNAVVMGVGGFSIGADPNWPTRKGPIEGVKLTMAETAALVSIGPQPMEFRTAEGAGAVRDAIVERNPQLDGALYYYQQDMPQGEFTFVSGSAVAETYLASRIFSTRVPTQWRYPVGTTAEGSAGKPLGQFASFALLAPTLSGAVTLKGRAELDGSTAKIRITRTTPTAAWYLTNLADAAGTKLAPAAVETSLGAFVAPTEASLQAAVPTLKADADGLLAPDPAPTADAAGAYPLTFVEYALVPAEPLMTEECKPRTASQTVLTSWLTYMTGPGQELLPAGLAPLTPTLKEQATATIAKVGKADLTGPCAPPKPPSTKPPATQPPGGGGPGVSDPGGGGGPGSDGFGTDGFGSDDLGDTGDFGGTGDLGDGGPFDDQALGADASFDSGAGGTSGAASEMSSSGTATRAPSATTRDQAADDVEEKGVELPSFFGAAPISALVPPLSLGAVALLTSLAALGTSGRPLPATRGLKEVLGRIRIPGRGR